MYRFRPSAEEVRRVKIYDTVKEILGGELLSLRLDRYAAHEFSNRRKSRIELVMVESDVENELNIAGCGIGLIDASYNALIKHYSKKYTSLSGIKFHSFCAYPSKPRAHNLESSSMVETIIEMVNSAGKTMSFREKDRSSLFSSLKCLISAICFYINSEKAFLKLKSLIRNAKERQRGDLVGRYQYKISEIVCVTSYENL